jgi:membrane-associated protein
MQLAGRERHAQRLALAEQVLLADHLVERLRAQALGERCVELVVERQQRLVGKAHGCSTMSAPGGGLNIFATLIVFYAAAILGNTSNYWIARFFGSRIIDSGKVKQLTPERMAKLDTFFEKYGGLTIIITRFMPFFRTFAPFIAGTGHMNFGKFTFFNVIGGIAWVTSFVLVGYFFGGIPFVQDNFEVIVLGIVAVSVAPAIIGAAKAALSSRK